MAVAEDLLEECPECRGRGVRDVEGIEFRCEPCRGTGEIYHDPGPKVDVRKVDPLTSKTAARNTRKHRWKRRAAALVHFQEAGAMGLTDYELACKMQEPHLRGSYSKVRGHLVKEGLVWDGGTTRPTDTGSQAIVWVATEAGRSLSLEDLFPEYDPKG